MHDWQPEEHRHLIEMLTARAACGVTESPRAVGAYASAGVLV
jgi:hypothetical protein